MKSHVFLITLISFVLIFLLNIHSAYSQTAIDWEHLTEAEVNGDSLKSTSTGGNEWGNSGARSVNWLPGGEDGTLEFYYNASQSRFRVGFAFAGMGLDYVPRYYIYHNDNGSIHIYEKGLLISSTSSISTGDTLRIKREGTDIIYEHNSTELRTVTVDDNNELIIEAQFYDSDGYIEKSATTLDKDLRVDYTATHIDPDDGADGAITLDVKGGTAPYDYSWSTSATTSSITSLTAGSYTVTVTDDNAGTVTKTIDVGYEIQWKDTSGVDVTANSMVGGADAEGVHNGGSSINYLAAGSDGWVEYTITGLYYHHQTMGMSEKDLAIRRQSIEFGIHSYAVGLTVYKGGSTGITEDGNIGDVLRIAREADTIRYYQNGNLIHSTWTDSSETLLLDASIYDDGLLKRVSASFGTPYHIQATIDHEAPGQGDASIDITVYGGDAPYTYSWSNSSTNEDQASLTAGTYTVTVTDNSSNTVSQSFEVGYELQWKDTIYATCDSQSIINNLGGGGWLSSGSSINYLAPGEDGYVEYVVRWVGTSEAIGLSEADYPYNVSYNYTEFNILAGGGTINLREATGVVSSNYESNIGDVWRLERQGDSLYYKRNGETLRTVWTDATEVMLIDVTLRHDGALEEIYTNIGVPFGAFAEVTEQSVDDETSGTIDITVRGGTAPYSFQWSNGSNSEDLTSLSSGNYTVTVTDGYANTITEAFEVGYGISWKDLALVTTDGNKITSTGGSGWIHGGSSENILAPYEDGYVEFFLDYPGNTAINVGLSETDENLNPTSVNYSIYKLNGDVLVREDGTTIGSTYEAILGDVWRIERQNDSIYYKRNSTTVESSATDASKSLLIDISINKNAWVRDIKTNIGLNRHQLYWVGTVDDDWDDPDNWSYYPDGTGGDTIPDSTFTVYFGSFGNSNATLQSHSKVDSLIIQSGYTSTISQSTYKLNIAGNFEMNGGTFTGGSDSLIISGDLSVNSGSFTSTSDILLVEGDFTNESDNFTHNSGTVVFIDSAASLNSASDFYNLVISDDDSIVLIGDLTVVNNLDLNDGTLVLDTNKLVLENGATSALSFDDGSIVAEEYNFVSQLEWHIGTNTGTYLIPFKTEAGDTVPITVDITSAGTGASGKIIISTFPTNPNYFPNNVPYPDSVANYLDTLTNDISLYMIDRYWLVEAIDYTAEPTADLTFVYTDDDLAGENIIDEDSLVIKNWDGSSLASQTATIDEAENKFNISGTTDYTVWVARDKENAPYTIGNTCENAIVISDDIYLDTHFQNDSIKWFTFTAHDSTYDRWSLFSELDFPLELDSISLFSGSCSTLTLVETATEEESFTIIDTTLSENTGYYLKVYSSPTNYEAYYKLGNGPISSCDLASQGGPRAPVDQFIQFCNPSSAAFLNKYRLQENWIPTDEPTKTLRVNVHIIQQSAANPNNFEDNNQDHLDYINMIFNWMNNDLISNLGAPSDPINCECGTSCHLTDSKIRFELMEVYFHVEPTLYGVFGNVGGLMVNGDSEINIFCHGRRGTGDEVGGRATLANATDPIFHNATIINMGNVYEFYEDYLQGDWFSFQRTAENFAHELGHILGLLHTCNEAITPSCGCCPETFDDQNFQFLTDVFGNGTGPCPSNAPHDHSWLCDAYASATDDCTNNLMNTGPTPKYLSPLQIGRMHRGLSISNIRRFVKDCPYNTSTPMEVSTDETWDFDIRVYRDIVIKTGATLTVTCRILMPDGANITVERGARLIVDGGTITSACDGMWKGIEVWGHGSGTVHPDKFDWPAILDGTYAISSSDHGQVILRNGALIENARHAIRADKDAATDLSFTGGVVFAEDATFRDCYYAAEFPSFKPENASYFTDCTFETIGPLNDQNTVPAAFVSMWDVQTIEFNNCEFINRTPLFFDTKDRGRGILSIDASFIVTGFVDDCVEFSGSECVWHEPNFSGLFRGVEAHASVVSAVNVNNTSFANNHRGVYLKGVQSRAQVTSCEIEVGEELTGSTAGLTVQDLVTYGIYLDGCDNFKIEENLIQASPDDPFVTADGIYVTHSGDAQNDVFANTFLSGGYFYASAAASYNNIGTEFKCNDFEDQMNHISVYSGQIKFEQGFCVNNQSPAGNIFFPSCDDNGNNHFWINTTADNFRYNHHTNRTPDTDCINRNNKIQLRDCIDDATVNSCPSRLPDDMGGFGCGVTCLIADIGDATANIGSLYASLDNNHTTGLVDYIRDTNVVEQNLVDSLVALSPWLSDDALLELMKRDKLVDSAKVGHILLLNSPHSFYVMRGVAEMNPPLPEDTLDKLLQYQDSSHARFDTMQAIYHQQHLREASYSQWLYLTRVDTSVKLDRLIDSLDNETDVNLLLKLGNIYLEEEEYGKVDTLYDSLNALNNEVEQLVKLRDITIDILSNDASWFDLETETYFSYKDDIIDIAATNTKAAIQAQAVLTLVYDSAYSELIEFRDTSGTSKGFVRSEKEVADEPLEKGRWKIYPNPATNELIVEYTLPEETKTAQFILYDLVGREMQREWLDNNHNKKNINLSNYLSGIYIYKIVGEKQNFHNGKLMIIK